MRPYRDVGQAIRIDVVGESARILRDGPVGRDRETVLSLGPESLPVDRFDHGAARPEPPDTERPAR